MNILDNTPLGDLLDRIANSLEKRLGYTTVKPKEKLAKSIVKNVKKKSNK